MKFYMLTLFIVLCQNQYVTSSIITSMTARFGDLATTLASAVQNVKQHVREFFSFRSPQRVIYQQEPLLQQPPDIMLKKTFAQFIERENETSPETEYKSMKAEPTALMSTPQLALLHGRRIESHVITTKDGYLLTIHRLAPSTGVSHKYSNQTIILHHGLLGSSADWILLGPAKSLPYLLSDTGYDVWMANARGNYYSRGHKTRKVDSAEYWKFSWQEIGEYDLAAVIDYVRKIKNITDQNGAKIDYVGHSMGTTALLVLLSTSPEYNRYLRIGILMAPLAFMSHVSGPLKAVMAMASSLPRQLLKLIGTKEFVPTRIIPKRLAMEFCKGPSILCCNPLYFITGGIPEEISWDGSFVARLLYHVPAGGSTDTILHYAQLVKNGKFHRFNDVHDEFDLSNITLPIALISSDEDWLATIPDVLRLYFSIASPIDHYIIRGKNFSHTEFMWGQDAKDVVFSKIFEYLDSGLNWFTMKSNEIQ